MPQPEPTLTHALAMARAGAISDCRYQLSFDLTLGDEVFGFKETLEFRGLKPGAEVRLDAAEEEIDRIEWNGAALGAEARLAGAILLPNLTEQNRVTIEGLARYNRQGLGMHLAIDPLDQERYVYTDLQPDQARFVFPCFDQPDLKGRFQIRIRTPRGWTAIAATPATREADDDHSTWWSFAETIPLSTYVLGIAAGRFHSVFRDHQGIPLGLHCARSLEPFLDPEDLFEITGQGLDYYQKVFQIPYPFQKYDQVFCPEKVDGAMESPACVTITDDLLFRGQATIQQRTLRSSYVLHEMAHMWFGDLVTLRWWDDLWLNESFATVMQGLAVNRATRYRDASTAVTSEAQMARRDDQRSTSHPVAVPVADVASVALNFDSITYEKGAAVLRQLAHWLGEELFFTGVSSYLDRYREGNAEFQDLISELTQASGKDVSNWAQVWLGTVGANTLRCLVADSGEVTITQTATPRQPQLRPHRLLVGSFDWQGEALVETSRVEVEIESELALVPGLGAHQRPALIIPNLEGLTYTKVRLDPASQATAMAHLSSVRDPMARAVLWDCLWDMVLDSEMPASRYLALVQQHGAQESDPELTEHVIATARQALLRYTDPSQREQLELDLAVRAEAVLDSSPPGSWQQMTWFRCFTASPRTAAQRERCLHFLRGDRLPQGIPLDLQLSWRVLQGLAAQGAVGEDQIADLEQQDQSNQAVSQAASARASLPNAAAKKREWERMMRAEVNLEEARAIALAISVPGQEQFLEPLMSTFPSDLDQALSRSGPSYALEMGLRVSRALPPHQELERALLAWLSRDGLDPELRRLLTDCLEDCQRGLSAQAVDRASSDSSDPG